jgi:Flp pilus assembly protein TadG
MVELALILTFLGGFFLLTFDYARAMNVYLVVVHAAREGARVAALEGTTTSQIETAAKNAAADFVAASALTVTCTEVTLNPATGAYTVGSACTSPRATESAFRVNVSTQFTPLVPFVGFGSSGRYTWTIPISYSLVGFVLDEPFL